MAANLRAIEAAILGLIAEHGELNDDEILTLVQENDDEATDDAIKKMVVKLDRSGKITRQNNERGYQVTANGRDALDGLRKKMEARHIAPYSAWVPVVCQFRLMSPTLGHVTDPGNVGISRFPRIGEEAEYQEVEREATTVKRKPGRPGRAGVTSAAPTKVMETRRIVTVEGQPIILGGVILTALQKAAHKTDPTVTVGSDGIRRVLPDVAWKRVRVKPIVMPSGTKLTRAVRRPTNMQGQSVGEIVHEAIPAGVLLTIRMTAPLSHFSESYLVRVFDALEDVGISGAGTGKGGHWGIGMVESLIVNGEQVWPGHPDTKTLGRNAAGDTLTGAYSARNVLESDQSVTTSATGAATASTVAAPMSDDGLVIAGTGVTISRIEGDAAREKIEASRNGR